MAMSEAEKTEAAEGFGLLDALGPEPVVHETAQWVEHFRGHVLKLLAMKRGLDWSKDDHKYVGGYRILVLDRSAREGQREEYWVPAHWFYTRQRASGWWDALKGRGVPVKNDPEDLAVPDPVHEDLNEERMWRLNKKGERQRVYWIPGNLVIEVDYDKVDDGAMDFVAWKHDGEKTAVHFFTLERWRSKYRADIQAYREERQQLPTDPEQLPAVRWERPKKH
jgi:hypothetical protein